jgi:hypothetical protein
MLQQVLLQALTQQLSINDEVKGPHRLCTAQEEHCC